MKKILLSAVALMGFAAAQAQDVPYIFTEVEANTYAITMTLEEMQATYPAEWTVSNAAPWGMGVAFPEETLLFENDKLTIKAATNKCPIYGTGGKLSQIQTEWPGYNGYVNCGSNLNDKDFTGEELILKEEFWQWGGSNNGFVYVVPKVDGTIKFGAYAGDNSRVIGIFSCDSNSDDLGMVSKNAFRNDGENGTVKNAPAYVEGAAKAGGSYALVAGGSKNLCVHQITFVPTGGTGIEDAEVSAEKTVEAYYTLDGVRMDAPAKGVNIVKYNDGTTVKVVK